MALTASQKRLLRNLAIVTVAAAGGAVSVLGAFPAATGAAAAQAFGLLQWQPSTPEDPASAEFVRKLRQALQGWAEGELRLHDTVEFTAGLELAVRAVAVNGWGWGWDGLAQAGLDAKQMADKVMHAARQADPEWACSEQPRFLTAEYAIREAAHQLAKRAAENEPLLVMTRRHLESEIAALKGRLAILEKSVQPSEVQRDLIVNASHRARAELLLDTLPPIDRSPLIRSGLDAMTEAGTPFAIIGDGGLGKSIIAGQIYDELVTDTHTVVLVPCSRIPQAVPLSTTRDVEVALCQAAAGTDHEVPPLSDVLLGLETDGSVTIIIDTLDLILNDQSATSVGKVLGDLATHHEVVVLCREREWQDFALPRFLPDAHVLSLPRLSPGEIVAWGTSFVTRTHGVNQAFLASLETAAKQGGASDVLGVPLRLAMACELYAGSEGIPDDLTVPSLYRTYWHRRVARDRAGFHGTAANEQEAAALSVAAAMWAASRERFSESGRPVGQVDWAAIGRLRSEGVLRETNNTFRFFHQTFGEFAVAQYLIASADAGNLEQLKEGLARNDSGMWGVASYLLPPKLEQEPYDRLAASIPQNSGKGMRILLLGALDQEDTPRCLDLVRTLARDAPKTVALYPELFTATAEDRVAPLATVLLGLMVSQTVALNRIATVVATMVKSLVPAERATVLTPALEALLSKRPAVDPNVLNPAVMRLFEGLPERLTTDDGALLVTLYESLKGATQALALRKFLKASAHAIQSVLASAMKHDLPEGAAEDTAHLLVTAWGDEDWRTTQGWLTWRDLLLADLPRRWDSAQTRAAVLLAAKDGQVYSELVQEALNPRETTNRPRVHNAAEFLATTWPQRTASLVLDCGISPQPMAVSTASQMLRRVRDSVSPDERSKLTELLWQHRLVIPKDSMPALMKLMADDDKQHARLVAELRRLFEDRTNDRVRWTCFDALLQQFAPRALTKHPELAELLTEGDHHNDRVNAAKLHGFLAPVSDSSRRHSYRILRQERSRDSVIACARILLQGLGEWDDADLDSFGVTWLVQLLPCTFPKAVEHIADLITARITTATWDVTLTQQVVDRIIGSLARHEDPPVVDKLTYVLGGVVRRPSASQDIEPQQVQQILEASWRALEEDQKGDGKHAPALWAQINTTASALATKCLDVDELNTLVVRIATTDSKPFSQRSARHTSVTFTAYLEQDLSRLVVLEDLWDRMPPLAQTALVQALDRGRIPGKEATAQRLLNKGAENSTTARLLAIVETGGSRTDPLTA